MGEGFLMGTALAGGELSGALVELRGHRGAFLRRAAQLGEQEGKLLKGHACSWGQSIGCQSEPICQV